MDFKDILRTRRIELGLMLEDIAKYVGVSTPTVSRWESGEIENIRRDKIARLAEILKVTPGYLMGWSDEAAPVRTLPDNIIPLPSTKTVPIIGTIACGQPIPAIEDADELVEAPEHVHADFALRYSGDSMIGARIMDGDIVFIRQQDSVQNGEIAAVIINDSATLKRVYYFPEIGAVILRAENSEYKDLTFNGEELNDIHILGKAVAFLSTVS